MKQTKPTDSELEILQVLWEKGEASVREVHDVLLKSKDIGYTTTLKIMQIMNEKGLLVRDGSAKTHIYKANVNREQTQQRLLDKMIDTVFNGSSSQLIIQALGNHKASEEELDEIQAYLDKLKK